MNRETRPIPPHEAPKLLTLEDWRSLLYMAIAVYTGRRVSEIRTMKWHDVLDESGEKIYIPKQNRDMYSLKHPHLVEIARKCYQGQPLDSYIFTGRRGSDRRKPMSITGINNYIVRPALRKLGIKTRVESSHCLRKTFAGLYMKANEEKIGPLAALRDLQDYFGHRSVEYTWIYIGFKEKMFQERINNIKL